VCTTPTEENSSKKIVDESNAENEVKDTAEEISNSRGEECGMAENDANPLTVEHSNRSTVLNTNSNGNSSVDDCLSDEDDKLLVEFCGKKTDCESDHDAANVRELSEDCKTVVASKTSDDVLWKDGDIEVRLEVGEDELSNSPACNDSMYKVSDQCSGDSSSDLPASKMPRTSIRISLSKLTARINGSDNSDLGELPHVKGSTARKGRVKGFRSQKPKLRKKRMKLRQSKSDDTKTGKSGKTKIVVSGKPKQSQDIPSIDSQPVKRPRGRPRRQPSQLVETSQSVETIVFSDTVNGMCTRRNRSNSAGKRVRSLHETDNVAELNVKEMLKDSAAGKSKKRRGSRGVEYIDDDAVSSPRNARDFCSHVTVKEKTHISCHSAEDCDISEVHADVNANGHPAFDKESEKWAMVIEKSHDSALSVNARKQVAGRKRRKSCSVTSNRSDISTHSDNSAPENAIVISSEDASTDDALSLKRIRTTSSTVEKIQPSSDNDERSKVHCTTEEMFRQIGRDGLECHICHMKLRTRTQLLQHAKVRCHLQEKSPPSDDDCFVVDVKKRHTSETEVPAATSERQSESAAESCKDSSDESDKKSTIHVDAINGVHIKNCVIEISSLTEKTDTDKTDTRSAETDQEAKPTVEEFETEASKSSAGAGDAMADCVCDGCGEVVPDCSWLTAHIVTCPGRSGAADENSSESFHPEWNGEQNGVLVSVSGLEPVAEDTGTQPVEVDAASLLQLLCNVENSLLCTVASENDVGSQPITVVSDSLLQENGSTDVTDAKAGQDVGLLGREVVHDGVPMYEFTEYRCSICPVTFLDRAAAIRHATGTKVHAACSVEGTSVYCCMQCDMRYRNQQLMWYHVTYICQQSEAAAVPASEVHRCLWCAKQFLTSEYLSRHCHIQHSTELSNIDSQMTLRELAVATSQQSTIANTDAAGSETQKQVLQALARATMRNGTYTSPKSRKEAALLRSKLVIASDSLPARRTAKGIVYKNVFMQCIVSYICSNCGRDLSTKLAKREHRVTAPDSCFDSGPGGRRLFTYVRHYSYLCPYCNERSATQKACRAHQLATCLPRMGVKTDELNHKQLLCPFCQRKYFNVITLKGHMTLVHQISRAESNQLLAGVAGATDEAGPHFGDKTTVNTASLNDSGHALQQVANKAFDNTASVDSVADDDDDNSVADDDDSNSIKSESVSRDSRFETVDPALSLFSSSNKMASSSGVNSKRRGSCTSSDDSSENDDVDVDNDSDDDIKFDDDSKSPVLMRRSQFSAGPKPKTLLSTKAKKTASRTS